MFFFFRFTNYALVRVDRLWSVFGKNICPTLSIAQSEYFVMLGHVIVGYERSISCIDKVLFRFCRFPDISNILLITEGHILGEICIVCKNGTNGLTSHKTSGLLTHWSLGNVGTILKIQFSSLLYWLVPSELLLIRSSDEWYRTLLMISQHWFR